MNNIIKDLKKLNIKYKNICIDSRKVKAGDIFVALPGKQSDGILYVDQAIQNGASIIISHAFTPTPSNIPLLVSKDIHTDLHALCRWIYNDPWEKIQTVAITGTNGKTSISYILESIAKANRYATGVIGTVNYRFRDTVIAKEQYTTPPPPDIYQLGQIFKNEKVDLSIIEASSQGLDQGRLDHIPIQIAIFTNLTREHLDYHQSMEKYLHAKKKLFDQLSPKSFAVIEENTPYFQELLQDCSAKVLTYGFSEKADIQGVPKDKQCMDIFYSNKYLYTIDHHFLGDYNLNNILASLATSHILGFMPSNIQKAFRERIVIPGRLEHIEVNKRNVFIDYAHTPDAFEKTLKTLHEDCPQEMWTVFGCGGNRDIGKRSQMGKIAENHSDHIILTSDNPRHEKPLEIIKDILKGIDKKESIHIIEEREKAISTALKLSSEGDYVLIAGRGHETSQEISGVKYFLSDRHILKNL
ncbi:hypothetical protein AB834_00735 [PVC group bacterium (ex Bugula neritina AB1)]|nr:hypothetical protein AB834_00735 [PVC group bacterium (ex Bugula neritina AB1)]